MQQTLKLSLAMTLVCVISAALLGFANEATREACKAAGNRKQQQLLRQLLPEFDNDPLAEAMAFDSDGAKVQFYPARKAGNLVGCAAAGASPNGFGGVIRVLVAISPAGVITNVLVGEHRETPGLGTVVTDRKETKSLWAMFSKPVADSAKLPPNRYLDQFTGRDLLQAAGPFQIGKGDGTPASTFVDGISGATISSRAVAEAVSQAAAAYRANQAQIKGDGK